MIRFGASRAKDGYFATTTIGPEDLECISQLTNGARQQFKIAARSLVRFQPFNGLTHLLVQIVVGAGRGGVLNCKRLIGWLRTPQFILTNCLIGQIVR